MSKISPFLEEVVYLVTDFLRTISHEKEAQKIQKQFQIPKWIQQNNPVLKKGLKKVLKQYINENQKVLKYYQTRKQQEQSQEQSEQQKVVIKNKKTASPKPSPINKPAKSPKLNGKQTQKPKINAWMASQFAQPKRLEDLNDNNEEVKAQSPAKVTKKQEKKSKKSKKVKSSSQESSEQEQTQKPKKQQKAIKKQKKVKGPVDSSCLDSEQQFQLQGKQSKKIIKKQIQQKKPSPVKPVIKSQIQTRKQSAQIEQTQQPQQNYIKVNRIEDNGPKKFFSRVDADQVGFIPDNRRDNTFEAKAKYGVGDSWGQFGYEKLKVTRGDSFKKTKGKLKNKAFQGSGINIDQVNSVPIL